MNSEIEQLLEKIAKLEKELAKRNEQINKLECEVSSLFHQLDHVLKLDNC